MNRKPIAFFDSGVGGITVLHEARKYMPNGCYLYYADTAHVPYGERSKAEVRDLVLAACEWIARRNPMALVIACNTGTSVAIDELRRSYEFPVIGMEPAVKPALMNAHNKKVLVFATKLTLRGNKFLQLLRRLSSFGKVDYFDLQELVTFAENMDFNSPQLLEYLKDRFKHITWHEYSSVVLGCTHFIFYRKLIQSMIPDNITIYDGNEGTLQQLRRQIGSLNNEEDGKIEFYNSGIVTDRQLFQSYFDLLLEKDTD